jgi:hypothetical protein
MEVKFVDFLTKIKLFWRKSNQEIFFAHSKCSFANANNSSDDNFVENPTSFNDNVTR